MEQQSPSAARGWIVTFAALGINLASGTLYAWGVMGKALTTRAEHPWQKAEAAYPFAAATAFFALTMIFAGRMQDRIGPKLIALLGGIVLGLGFIAASFTDTPLAMAAAFALVGVGIGLSYAATTPAAIKWFSPSRRGLITGIVVSGVGLAAVYAAPLASYLLNDLKVSIPHTLQILGVGTILAIGILSQVVSNPPAGYKPAGAAGGSAPAKAKTLSARRDVNWPEMLTTPQFYLLWVTFVLTASAGLMLISNVGTIAKLQAKWELGFLPIMLLAIFNTSGRFAGGAVSDRLGRRNTMLLAFVLQAANMFLFHYYTTPVSLAFGACFAGLCYGAIFTLMPAASADFYGVKNLGVNFGFLFTAFGVAGVTGSILGGKVADIFGTYDRAYMACGVMLLIGVVLALATRAPELAVESTSATPVQEPAKV